MELLFLALFSTASDEKICFHDGHRLTDNNEKRREKKHPTTLANTIFTTHLQLHNYSTHKLSFLSLEKQLDFVRVVW